MPAPKVCISPSEATHKNRLAGSLNTSSIVFMVIAAAAPLTVIGGNVPLMIAAGNGIGAPVGFVIAALVMLMFSIGFIAMTPHVEKAGAFYAYVSRGWGISPGTGTALLALLTYTSIQVGVYAYMGGVLRDVVHGLGGPNFEWWVYTILTALVVALLGYRHIELSSKVLSVALIFEIGVVVVLDVVIVASGGDSGINFSSFTPAAAFSGPIGIAVLFALTGFIGFESTAVFRDEAINPDRTVPRATYIAVVIIGSFYAMSSWAVILGFGADKAIATAQTNPINFIFLIMERYLGSFGRDVTQVLLITSLFACVLSLHNVIARYKFALADRAYMPSRFGTVHLKHRSPAFASLAQSITALLLIIVFATLQMDPLTEVFAILAGIATEGIIIIMVMTSIAVLVFFIQNPQPVHKLWQHIVAPTVSVLLLFSSLYLVLSNFPLVVGGTVELATVLAVIPFAVLVLGLCLGKWLPNPRSSPPHVVNQVSLNSASFTSKESTL